MKTIDIHISMEFCPLEELSSDDQRLVQKAVDATNHSYAPYSGFHVGAALRVGNGLEVTGANQENAAFPSGLCAERSAIFAAQSNYPDQPIRMLAIAARDGGGLRKQPVSPCGSCRQVVIEMEDRYKQPIEILLFGKDGIYRMHSIKDLLPFSFTDSDMR
jgi:cytidine deaminase